MATFVLVHGAWHGAWCWDQVVPRLEAQGHEVVAPDLPGHGADRTPPAEITMDAYAGFLQRVLESLANPAVLVGHSFGGVVISQAAERRPEAVGRLVYLCAFLLRDGQSLWRHGWPGGPGGDSVFRSESLRVDEAAGTVDLDRSVVPGTFYGGCPQEAVERALERWRPEPLEPMRRPLALTPGRYGAVPRAYIRCSEDRVVPPQSQDRMCRLTPCGTKLTLRAGHSPFLSVPGELAAALDSLAGDQALP